MRSYESALNIFQRWTQEVGLSDMNTLAGRDLARFKTWRKNETDVNRVSLNGTLGILRTFLRFCERIEAVEDGIVEKVQLSNVPEDEEVRTDAPDDETVEAIHHYYGRFEYASRRHAAFELIAEIESRCSRRARVGSPPRPFGGISTNSPVSLRVRARVSPWARDRGVRGDTKRESRRLSLLV
jgi:hypothetical protein